MILGILQARMSSSRLPGKVLLPIMGVPMLLIMWDRAAYSKMMDMLVVATSKNPMDNPIEEVCGKNGITCFRGELIDVLDRYYQVSQMYKPAHIVRLTGDCPMIEPEIIDKTIWYHLNGGFDYTRNYGYPDGWDVEVMTIDALRQAWTNAQTPYEREHVTPYIYFHPGVFKLGRYESQEDLSYIKLSVDTVDDFMKVSKLIELCLNSTLPIHRDY